MQVSCSFIQGFASATAASPAAICSNVSGTMKYQNWPSV